MEIHRFEKIWLGASLLLIVGLIATIAYGAIGPGVAMVDDSGGTVDPSNPTASENFRQPGVYQTGGDGYAVYVLAQRFSFRPGSGTPIRVPADTRVTFYVTSADVTHGFEVVGTNVNTMVIPGQVAEITVRFDEPGTYHVVCNEYCGAAHHAMEGVIEVVPRSEYDLQRTEVTDS
ncbi:MAG: cytochrome c oxidase subunit II [Haloquadratum sp.]